MAREFASPATDLTRVLLPFGPQASLDLDAQDRPNQRSPSSETKRQSDELDS
jgi:hypothetical protein